MSRLNAKHRAKSRLVVSQTHVACCHTAHKMFFEEVDANDLKAWLVIRLPELSDADSDVLADYVSRLLGLNRRHAQRSSTGGRVNVDDMTQNYHSASLTWCA